MRSPRIGSASGVITLQFDFPADSQRRKKIDGFPRNFVEVEAFQFEGCLFQQAAHPPDDFAGALVVLQNIVHDFCEFVDVRVRRLQDCLRRFGVGQIAPKRLVDFVSDRGGQFASGREAVDMGKLCHALPRLHFGKLTPTMLTQQDRDKPGLYKKYGDSECDLPRNTAPTRLARGSRLCCQAEDCSR